MASNLSGPDFTSVMISEWIWQDIFEHKPSLNTTRPCEIGNYPLQLWREYTNHAASLGSNQSQYRFIENVLQQGHMNDLYFRVDDHMDCYCMDASSIYHCISICKNNVIDLFCGISHKSIVLYCTHSVSGWPLCQQQLVPLMVVCLTQLRVN